MSAALVCLASTRLLAQTAPVTPAPAQNVNNDPQKIEPLKQSITVNGSVSTDAPGSIEVLTKAQLDDSPGVSLDDVLRIVPGFSLFRRSSGVAANPTTQGVSLRGMGSSGASRTLILWDGIPANSPFGGWVYWNRLAPEEVERVEVSRGASTSVFGDKAMGGAVDIFTRPAEPWHLTAFSDGGNAGTAEVGLGASHVWKRIGVTGFVRAFDTDGYFIVPANIRGRVDTHAGVEFVAGNIKIDFLGAHDRFFLKLDTLAEHRNNGTMLTKNSSALGTLAASWTHEMVHDELSVLAYHTQEEYRSTYSSIAATRATETLSLTQNAPSEATGAAGFWQHNQSGFTILGGGDFNRVEGYSHDLSAFTKALTTVGGVRDDRGFFGQANVSVGPAKLFLGARQDWTGDGGTFFSPNAGATIGKHMFRGRASAYRSFRAPTLNELYRQFRVGNTLTLANSALVPETLFGSEIGFDIVGETRRFSLTGYRNALDNVITNVTLSTTPSLITAQRQNSSSAVTHGAEANFQQTWRRFRGELSYLYADSRYSTGQRIPQVPKSQGSAQLIWQRKGTLIASGVRAYSSQFEDALNTPGYRMAGFANLIFSARQQLKKSLSATFEMENALSHVYYTGFTPAPQIGGPRLVRVGLQWDGSVRRHP